MVRANGLDFACDVMGTGPDVALCLHGFPESRFSWRYQLPVLAGLGWRAVAPDLRGYAGSSRPQGKAAYHIDHLVDDVVALFDALGARRRLLVAHDWGALIAWVVAMRRAVPLDGMVIMNVPHPQVFARELAAGWHQRKKSWYAAFFQIPGLPEWLLARNRAEGIGKAFTNMAVNKAMFPPEVTDVYRDNASQPGALTAMINYYRSNTAIVQETAPAITVPTCMIWGEEDAALDISLTRGYDGLVADFTLHTLPCVSHWVQQEAPKAVNALMADWLRAKGLAF